jgi:hypothetical protein
LNSTAIGLGMSQVIDIFEVDLLLKWAVKACKICLALAIFSIDFVTHFCYFYDSAVINNL